MVKEMTLFNADNYKSKKHNKKSPSSNGTKQLQHYPNIRKALFSSSASKQASSKDNSSSSSSITVTGNYTVVSSANKAPSSMSDRKDVTSPANKAKADLVEWEDANDKKKAPANVLSKTMLKHYHFIKTRNPDGSDRLMMYVSDKKSAYYGLYTGSRDQMEETFRLIDQNFNSHSFDNVALGIKAHAPVLNPFKARKDTKHLIPVKNGIVNMSKKPRTLLPFNSKYFFTTKIITPYPLKKPKMPVIKSKNGNTWTPEKFMHEISNGDPDTTTELWQAMLDGVDGSRARGKAVILLGPASTGKSSFEAIIGNIVGWNLVGAKTIDQLSGRFAPADLLGKDVDLGDNLSTDVIVPKGSIFHAICTGDAISVEPKGQKAFSVHITCAIINSSNGLPRFKDVRGIKRRLLIIPFTHKFHDDGNNVKSNYLSRLDVRQWFLYKTLSQPDFSSYYVSPKSKKLLKEYIISSNPLKQFELDYFNKWNLDKVPTKVLYKYFLRFVDINNYKIMSSAKFSRQFRRLIQSRYTKKTAKLSEKDRQQIYNINNNSELKLDDIPLIKSGRSYKCFVKVK